MTQSSSQSEEHEPTSNRRAAWTIFVLLFILVVLPVGSWFYLKSGVEFRKERMEELTEFGQILRDTLADWNSSSADQTKILRNRVLVLTKATPADSIRRIQQKMLDQFNDRKDFGMIITEKSSEDGWYSPEKNMTTNKSLYRTTGKNPFHSPSWIRIDTTFEHLPASYALLADTSGSLRKLYDLEQISDRTKLIEHIAMILPVENKRRAN